MHNSGRNLLPSWRLVIVIVLVTGLVVFFATNTKAPTPLPPKAPPVSPPRFAPDDPTRECVCKCECPVCEKIVVKEVAGERVPVKESHEQPGKIVIKEAPQDMAIVPYKSAKYTFPQQRQNASPKENLDLMRTILSKIRNVKRDACPKPVQLGANRNPHYGYDGHREEGQWRICENDKLTRKDNCTAISFGVREDWTLEEALVKNYDCEVWSYDPTINGIQTPYKKLHFDRFGIAGDESRADYHRLEWFFQRNKIGILDVLKVDVENWEWPMLDDLLKTTLLRNRVRQFTFEVHYFFPGIQNYCSPTDYSCINFHLSRWDYWFNVLEEQGFVLYDYHQNPHSVLWNLNADADQQTFHCCHELSFVNTRLFHV